MSKDKKVENIEVKVEEAELKEYSVTIENMLVGKKIKQCIIVKVFNPLTQKYVMFESEVPKVSVLGKEIAEILKEVRKQVKLVNKNK